ncbi:MAG: efflux RND transporter periplasmic adaptor subunit [Candidatus Loosdrechtia sp.]|uniref:efflux RND transporter periplasmic adaptor subunit n=1 Tax=Candidatus Loosdrechtia sp. TaxID=3101272 RepID=UPI003A6764B8|nr:MAG: efflux RND transporter periplasmic adaptor subunit [Candidatus Jettenia sp. AMX2]
MSKRIYGYILIVIAGVLITCNSLLFGEDITHLPPAKVVVSEVVTSTIIPETEFIGTVYYIQVSNVASEVSGKIDMLSFEEGERVRKGHALAEINSDLLKKAIKTKTASYKKVLSDLELAKKDFVRVESLFREKVVAEQIYDDYRFRVTGLEKESASIKAEIEGLKVELQKKVVTAPFDGVIIKKHTDVGEWLSPGSIVASLARDDIVDVIVNVPEEVCILLTPGMEIPVRTRGREIHGKIFTVVPHGDIATRTFPVKIRINNSHSLIAGAEARVSLPRGEERKTLLVKRDALIPVLGNTVVFAVVDSFARMIPVKVTGYHGIMAGIESPELEEGMKVVIKGNERLQNHQMVNIINVVKIQPDKRTL